MKLKLGTRVIVKGVETFISELHEDMKRGVYKVRTSNPTYEFTPNDKGVWEAYINYTEEKGCDYIKLVKASKFGNYQTGDRVKLIQNARQGSKRDIGTITAIEPERLIVTYDNSLLSREGFNLDGSFSYSSKTGIPILKKLRVKL